MSADMLRFLMELRVVEVLGKHDDVLVQAVTQVAQTAAAEAEARGHARGGAEAAALRERVEALAEEFVGEATAAASSSDPELAHPYLNAAARLRAVLAEGRDDR